MTAYPDLRKAITRTDVLIAIALVLVVLLLLPLGVLKLRETSARSQCMNNVQRIGEAVAAYANSHNRELVPLCVYNPRTTDSSFPSQYDSCFFLLLPYLGESNLYQLLREHGDNWSFAARVPGAPTPSTFLQTNGDVKVYTCPSASDYKLTFGPDSTPLQNYTNYAVNYLLLGIKNPGLEKSPSDVPYSCGPEYRIDMIPDGTSNTVLLTEKNAQFNFWDRPAPIEPIYASMFGCVLNPSAPDPYPSWASLTADARDTPLYVRVPGNRSFQRPSSIHKNGIVAGMTDGTARIVGYDVTPMVWRSAIEPDDVYPPPPRCW